MNCLYSIEVTTMVNFRRYFHHEANEFFPLPLTIDNLPHEIHPGESEADFIGADH